jgi:hypothetical protein
MTSADRPAKLFDDRFERPAHCPVGIFVAQLAEIGNVANVVAAAVFIHILVREFVAERLLKTTFEVNPQRDLRNHLEAS